MKNARTQTAILVALGAALAMPLALAQSAEPPQAQEVAAEQAAQDAQDAQDAATATQPEERQLGWNDVDADGNGTISREESAALPALAASFDEADADGDGELTAEEYRAHAAKAGGN